MTVTGVRSLRERRAVAFIRETRQMVNENGARGRRLSLNRVADARSLHSRRGAPAVRGREAHMSERAPLHWPDGEETASPPRFTQC